MSQNLDTLIITGSIDEFDLEYIPYNTYWFKLKHLPILKSLIMNFEYFNSTLTSDSKIVVITNDRTEFCDNIYYTAYTTENCNEYAKCLIGTSIIENKQEIKITSDNYLQYKYLMIGYCFIDFSRSEQITSILDSLDSSGNRECNHFTATYFYEV